MLDRWDTGRLRFLRVIPVEYRTSLVDRRRQVVLGPSVTWLEGGS